MASSDTPPDYLANYGRPPWDGPPSIDHLHPELNEPVDVVLIVRRDTLTQGTTSRDLHWMIQWRRGVQRDQDSERQVVCRLQIVRDIIISEGYPELGQMGEPLPHLTNWGPITTASSGVTFKNPSVYPGFVIDSMSKEGRVRLANIADHTPVRVSDGEWNCQDWTKTVLKTAVAEGLINQAQYDDVIAKAEDVRPLPL